MLKIKAENKGGGGGKVRPGRRLYYTADRSRLVEAGDPEAASLYCSEFKEVSAAEFESLMPPKPPEAKPEPEPEPEADPPKPKPTKKRPAKKRATRRKK